MVHFGAQLTVKALSEGEVVYKTVIYGLSIQYEGKQGNLYQMNMNLMKPVPLLKILVNSSN